MADIIPVNPSPRDYGILSDAYWPHQLESAHWLGEEGNQAKALVAPTGTGKTLVKHAALGVARESNPDLTAYSLTSTKYLQKQELDTVENLHRMNGRSFYDCKIMPPLMVDQGPCQSGYKCPIKSECTYYQAKAITNEVPTTSMPYAMWVADRKYVGDFLTPNILVCDEAHVIEREMMNAVAIKVWDQQAQRLGLPLPPRTLEGLQLWAVGNQADVRADIRELADIQADGLTLSPADHQKLKELRSIFNTMKDLMTLQNPDNWVVEHIESYVELRPIFIHSFTDLIFGQVDRLMMLSATIPDLPYFFQSLGIESWSGKIMKSTFDPRRRPIVIDPIRQTMNRHTEPDCWDEMVEKIDAIFDKYPTRKGVIHSVSYSRAQYIAEHSRHHRRMIAPSSQGKGYALDAWPRDNRPLIFVSPSIWEGIDMPGHLNEVQVICKVPYPYLGSPQIRERSRQDERFIPNQTCLVIAQATGRAMRSATDSGITYITDPAIDRVIDQWGDYLPDWWHEALVRRTR